MRIVSIGGKSDSGKLIEQECSSQKCIPPIVRIGVPGLVIGSLRFFANTRLTIVKGEPLSRRAVIACGFGYSQPSARPASIVSAVAERITLISGPGSSGSNGFQGASSRPIIRRQNTLVLRARPASQGNSVPIQIYAARL